MMAASSVLSLFAVLWLSRLMMRHSPAKVVPTGFAVGGAALLAEWTLSFFVPRLAAVAVYLHMAFFGAAMISAFWSLINETYDPHTGKGAVAAITGGGTLGGLLGGLVAWRASTMFSVPTMLPILAAVSLVASWGSFRLSDPKAKPLSRADVADVPAASMLSPLRELRDAPYLQHLAAIVALGATTSGLLDYVFSAEAAKAFDKGPALLAFFALFWLIVGALSFLVQTLLGRVALERLGLAVTIALLPGVVVLGGAVGLAMPGLWSTAILRGGEATQRNSLFRAAYELLYTPLSEQRKRTTKTLIDVGFDRVGTMSAAGVAVVTLWLAAGRAETILLAVAIACALVALARSRRLHMGYVAVLEESLRKGAEKTQPPATVAIPATVERAEVRDKIVEHLDALPHSADLAAICAGDTPLLPKQENGARTVGKTPVSVDVSLEAIADLVSGNAQRVRRALLADGPLDRSLVSFAILLLADKESHSDAIRALRKVVAKTAGQLIDALCDPSVDFQIRRRIPRILSQYSTQSVADGLIRGTEDARFEVRYECGRALLKITCSPARVVIALETVIAIVQREVSRSKDVWDSQPASDLDEEDNEASELCDRLLRDRIDRSLEHVFTILALHLDRDSLRIAFHALHEKDERIRGTALEYLETVLPDEIRDAVWPFLGEARPMRAARPAREILADLRQATKAPEPATTLTSRGPTLRTEGANKNE
jgi:ATP:ADP antiporter, AAA family